MLLARRARAAKACYAVQRLVTTACLHNAHRNCVEVNLECSSEVVVKNFGGGKSSVCSSPQTAHACLPAPSHFGGVAACVCGGAFGHASLTSVRLVFFH